MQARPPPVTEKYHPPAGPRIPTQAVQSLIPRLTTTINDIDNLKALIAHGAQDGNLPNWETLLQRYSLLLGRINALSAYLAQPTPPPAGRAGLPSTRDKDTRPALERFIIHPLNPLPANQETPMASDAFFQVINTQPLSGVAEDQARLLSAANRISGQEEWVDQDAIRKMTEQQLEVLSSKVKARLEREKNAALGVLEMIEKHEEEYDWGMRIGGDDEEGETAGKGDEEDDDLFGDDEEVSAALGISKTANNDDQADDQAANRNPRAGWTVAKYLRYMDTGSGP